MTAQAHADQRRIASLDGLRGLAIVGVLLAHSGLTWNATLLRIPPPDGLLGSAGRVGVELFFVLSAFLITGILLDARASATSVRNFYARRALRILPLYYVVLLGLLVFQAPGAIAGFEPWYWLHLSNWAMAEQGKFASNGYGVMWSLAVEEQFYVLWPIAVIACGRSRLLGLAIAGVFVALLWRIALVILGQPHATIVATTPSHFDSLGIGAALAILSRNDAWLTMALGSARWIAGIAGLALSSMGVASGGFVVDQGAMQTIGYSLLAVCCGSAVVLCAGSRRESLWRRATEAGGLCLLGRYSYCLYLIHLPVGETIRGIAYGRFATLLFPLGLFGQVVVWAAIVGVSLALSWLSWHYLEGPLLSLKRFVPYASEQPMPQHAVPVQSTDVTDEGFVAKYPPIPA